MEAGEAVDGFVGARAQAVDVAVGAALFAVALILVPQVDRGWRVVAVAAVACAGLAVRRRRPVAALAVAAAAAVLAIPVSLHVPAGIALLLAAYAVGAGTGRTTVVAAGLAAAGVVAAGGTLVAPESWKGPNAPVTMVAAILVGAAVGDAVRSRRQVVVALQERARRAEQALEAEARRRVAEERLRIAREVHDLVAHHIAVVNVQAGVAAHHLPDRPEAAQVALGHVRSATRTILEEFKTMVGMLRGAGDPVHDAPVEPTPGLAVLGKLLEECAASGQRVDSTVTGTARPLPAPIDLVAYRVILESLTNARAHGRGRARLALRYTPGGLDIEIGNEYPDPGGALEQTDGAGHGLVGMRERVAAVGGSLEAGPARPGEFLVKAYLPATTRDAGAGA